MVHHQSQDVQIRDIRSAIGPGHTRGTFSAVIDGQVLHGLRIVQRRGRGCDPWFVAGPSQTYDDQIRAEQARRIEAALGPYLGGIVEAPQ